MIVVADSSPINYLVLIGHVHLLADLFGDVVVPYGVIAELQSKKAPQAVRDWLQDPPRWFRVESVSEDSVKSIAEPYLHRGELEAIALAQLLDSDYLIIDEKAGRQAAIRRQLSVIGTIGVLEKADEEGLLTDLSELLDRLGRTTFYMSHELREALLRRHRERVP